MRRQALAARSLNWCETEISNGQFQRISRSRFTFLADLRDNNDRAWFNPRKAQFKRDLQTRAIAFVEALGARLQSISPGINFDTRTNGAGSLMRIYRDTRFSNDKTPYKTNIGIVFWKAQAKDRSAGFLLPPITR